MCLPVQSLLCEELHLHAEKLSRRVWELLMLLPTCPNMLLAFQNISDDTVSLLPLLILPIPLPPSCLPPSPHLLLLLLPTTLAMRAMHGNSGESWQDGGKKLARCAHNGSMI